VITLFIKEAKMFQVFGSDRKRVEMLVEMNGITPAQQQELFNMAVNPFGDADELQQKCKQYELRGATFRYSKTEVDRLMGVRKPLWKQLIGL
jgi:hypothetical protein